MEPPQIPRDGLDVMVKFRAKESMTERISEEGRSVRVKLPSQSEPN